MTPFKFNLPPKKPGVYAFVHEPTKRVYVGSTTSLHRRFQEWRSVINSGSYWKSGVLADAIAGTFPDEWTFYVMAEYDDVEEASAAEQHLIQAAKDRNPLLSLNTKGARALKHTAAEPKTVVIGDSGKAITYREAAEELGCKYTTLAKRLAGWRDKGRTVVTLDFLREKRAGRPRKDGVAKNV